MTIRGIFKFYGDEKDTYHMPKPCYLYMVYSSSHPTMVGYSIVSIVISSHPSPLPDIKEYTIETEAREAIDDVFDIIANLKENKKLRSIKRLEEVKEERL
jgi:hypothetical protein